MGRMHSKGKGMSSSALPYKRSPPSWLKISAAEVSWSLAMDNALLSTCQAFRVLCRRWRLRNNLHIN